MKKKGTKSVNGLNALMDEGLCEQDSNHMLGWDDAVQWVGLFLNSVDMLTPDFNRLGIKMSAIDKAVLWDERDIFDFTDDEISKWSDHTKLFKYMQHAMNKYMDLRREYRVNDMVSFPDTTAENSNYDINMLHYRTGLYKNAIVRHREYSEKVNARNMGLVNGRHDDVGSFVYPEGKWPFRP